MLEVALPTYAVPDSTEPTLAARSFGTPAYLGVSDPTHPANVEATASPKSVFSSLFIFSPQIINFVLERIVLIHAGLVRGLAYGFAVQGFAELSRQSKDICDQGFDTSFLAVPTSILLERCQDS